MNTLPTLISLSNIEIIEGEPRIQDTVLAEALSFGKARDIRPLIQRNLTELLRFGSLATHTRRLGKNQQTTSVYYLNEKQALYITAKSTTAKAADVTVAMVEVFSAWRAGHLVPVSKTETTTPSLPLDTAPDSMELFTRLVDELLTIRLAPVTTSLEKSLAYKTGEDKGEQKMVATTQQAGRLISMAEKMTSMLETLLERTSGTASISPEEQTLRETIIVITMDKVRMQRELDHLKHQMSDPQRFMDYMAASGKCAPVEVLPAAQGQVPAGLAKLMGALSHMVPARLG